MVIAIGPSTVSGTASWNWSLRLPATTPSTRLVYRFATLTPPTVNVVAPSIKPDP